MANAPTINTDSWRLPKRAHSKPEATFTDDMYRAKGLPVDPERMPTTGGSGLPAVDTSEWRLPTKEERESRLLSEAKQRRPDQSFEVELDDEEFDDLGDEYDPADFVDLEADEADDAPTMQEVKTCPGSFLKRRLRVRVKGQQGLGRGAGVGQGKGPIGRQGMGPSRAADDDAVGESVRSVQRRLAGLTESRHLEFATGLPYRRMPNETRPKWSRRELAEGVGSYYMQKFKNEDTIYFLWSSTQQNGNPKGFQVSWYIDKRSPTKAKQISVRNMSLWKPIAEKDLPAPVAKKFKAVTEQSSLPSEQAELAGMTERSPLPHPMGDTRSVGRQAAHGILDDGQDATESYINQVLEESRWFFRDFGDLSLGAVRPFGEAPGGRAGPWRGSDDEPAETPVVRQGKVKGVVGQDDEDEPEDDEDEPEDDEDEPEDDEDEPEDDEEMPPAKKGKSKAKAPEEPEDGDDEDEDEEEETTEADTSTSIGRHLKALGGHMKQAGHKAGSSKAAERAKHGLHKRLSSFAAKHGIDVSKHFGGDAAKKKAPTSKSKKPLARKPKPLARKPR